MRLVRTHLHLRIPPRRRKSHMHHRKRRLALSNPSTQHVFELLEFHLVRKLRLVRHLRMVDRRGTMRTHRSNARRRHQLTSLPRALLQAQGLRLVFGGEGPLCLVRSHPTMFQFLGLHQRVSVWIV